LLRMMGFDLLDPSYELRAKRPDAGCRVA